MILNRLEEIERLKRRLVETEDTERRIIARELHDEIGQNLIGLKMILAHITLNRSNLQCEEIQGAQSTVSDLIQQVREMALRLRPSMLDDLGLLPILQ